MHFMTGNGMQVEGSVELQHVAFAYPVRPDCLVSVLYFKVPCQSSLGQNAGMLHVPATTSCLPGECLEKEKKKLKVNAGSKDKR